jgi:nucleoside-diphosphate-sugar epimerase
MRVFVAGATGVIGQFPVPGLIAAGHQVTAGTRSHAKAGQLTKAGATPVIVDGLNREAVLEAVAAAEPEVIIDQMTALRSGSPVKTEQDPLDPHRLAVNTKTMAAIRHLEQAVPEQVPEGSYLGVKPPVRDPAWLGRLLGGEMVVSLMTEVRPASNEKAKRKLGWTPKYPSWRDGFPVWAETFKPGEAA